MMCGNGARKTIWNACNYFFFPASISYAKVDAKMDSIIAEFCIRVVQLRETQGKLMESPAHARMILHGIYSVM